MHRDLFELPAGATVTAVSFDPDDPYGRVTVPDFGLYLDDRWAPPWLHEHVPWPDFAVPADPAALLTALQDLMRRARLGQVVEVGCFGGHGRTGTALACLARLTGQSPRAAVAWIRSTYCDQAVETHEQVDFVACFPGAG